VVIDEGGPGHSAASHRSVYRSTGTPGRPTSKHFVLAELDCRIASGTAELILAAEARALETYLNELRVKDPTVPPLAARRIETVIREKHRHWRLGQVPENATK
jgi:hypothetical protein